MIEINLLPWRDQLRVRQKKHFILAIIVSSSLTLLLILCIHFFIAWQIKITHANTHLIERQRNNIAPQVTLLRQLQQQKNAYLQRQQLLKQIYAAQTTTLTLFNTLNHTIPSTIYLTELSRSNQLVSLIGKASSALAIADFFKRLQDSQQFSDLQIIESRQSENAEGQTFRIEAKTGGLRKKS